MRSFASVSSVEMDADRVMDLRHNVDCIMGLASSQGLSAATVTTHQGDYVELMKQLEQDIVFIDPPWGGPAYKDGQGGLLEDLYLGEASVAWLCWDLLQTQAQIVALRLPSVLPVNVFLRAMDPSCCDDAKRKEVRRHPPHRGVFNGSTPAGPDEEAVGFAGICCRVSVFLLASRSQGRGKGFWDGSTLAGGRASGGT